MQAWKLTIPREGGAAYIHAADQPRPDIRVNELVIRSTPFGPLRVWVLCIEGHPVAGEPLHTSLGSALRAAEEWAARLGAPDRKEPKE